MYEDTIIDNDAPALVINNKIHTNWRKSILKAFKLNSNKIHKSTGIPIYYVNRWMAGYAVPEFVEMTINSFYEEIDTELTKLKAKLNLN